MTHVDPSPVQSPAAAAGAEDASWSPNDSTLAALAAKIERWRITKAARDVLAERRRQIDAEGWTVEHDDGHGGGEMAFAACCYISPDLLYRRDDRANEVRFTDPWPWSPAWDRRLYDGNVLLSNDDAGPERRRRTLVKGLALGLAEIERIDRAADRARGAQGRGEI